MKNLLLFFVIVFQSSWGLTQIPTQTVRGKVVDLESKFPLIGVSISIRTDDDNLIGNVTDVDGNYRIENVPVGRRRIEFSYLGYETVVRNNVILSSAKEVLLNVEMSESATDLEVIQVIARRNGQVNNELATVSAREFSVDETNRYAGSRGEPARMASNFAGVQGADDSRNDIVIRGNSPQGVLWRLDGINIPNPNHFAIPGTGGGPVTILNNKFLSNSDFFTGAFPAEYGNGIAGVFDLKMRNGNNEKHEFSGQLGFLGTEMMAEGPISKNHRSSYLGTFRYSTLQLFSFMGIEVGTDALPKYFDGALRLNFPRKNGGNIAVWGVGGMSTIDIILSEDLEISSETLIYGSNDRDQYFSSRMGVGGITYTQPIDKNTYLKTGVAISNLRVDAYHDYFDFDEDLNKPGFYRIDTLDRILDYQFDEVKYHAYASMNKKIGKSGALKFGINADLYEMSFIDSVRLINTDTDGEFESLDDWKIRWMVEAERAILLQPFVHYKWKPNDRLTLSVGLTSLYFGLNDNSFSPLEPRIGLNYQLLNGHKLGFGAGMHSQIQSPYLYYYSNVTIDRDPKEYNKDLGLTKNNHLVLSYEGVFAENMRFKAETYYQYLTNIPVESKESSFSLANTGSGFTRFFPDTLVNEGIGRNYGFEITVEKFFSDGYYYLLTGSVFDAKYQGSNGIWRNTTFNGNYALNALFAREITFKRGGAFSFGGKATFAGGRRYGDVDEAASKEALEIIWAETDDYNEKRFKPYFRMDAKLGYIWNRPRVTHEFSIDIVNVFNIKNILTLTYAPNAPDGNPIREEYQLGFLPVFYYKIDF